MARKKLARVCVRVPSSVVIAGRRWRYIEKFAAARKKEGPQMMAACEDLLGNADSERGVRVGDIFALMVEYYYSQGDHLRAYHQPPQSAPS